MLIQNDAEILTQQRRFNDQNQIHTIVVVAVSVTVQYANSKRRRNTTNSKNSFKLEHFLLSRQIQ